MVGHRPKFDINAPRTQEDDEEFIERICGIEHCSPEYRKKKLNVLNYRKKKRPMNKEQIKNCFNFIKANKFPDLETEIYCENLKPMLGFGGSETCYDDENDSVYLCQKNRERRKIKNTIIHELAHAEDIKHNPIDRNLMEVLKNQYAGYGPRIEKIREYKIQEQIFHTPNYWITFIKRGGKITSLYKRHYPEAIAKAIEIINQERLRTSCYKRNSNNLFGMNRYKFL